MKICFNFLLVILTVFIFFSCKDSTYYREKHGLINEYDVDYDIQSIRVDDDSEYHIVAVSKKGYVETIHDADIPYDIQMKYGTYNRAFLRIHYSDRCCGIGKFHKEGVTRVYLPIGYKIETFDD